MRRLITLAATLAVIGVLGVHAQAGLTTMTVTASATAIEGSLTTSTVVASFDADTTGAPYTAVAVWADGSTMTATVDPFTSGDLTTGVVTVTYSFPDDTVTTVAVAITGEDDLTSYSADISPTEITVLNDPPVVTAGADAAGVEGSPVTIDPLATFTDAGVDDTHAAIVDWGDGSAEEAAVTDGSGAGTVDGASHTYVDNGTYTVAVAVTDDDGGIATSTLTVTIDNATPAVTAGADTTGVEGSPVTIDPIAVFTDAGASDAHTAIVDWGDGSSEAGVVAEADGAGTVTVGAHAYADNSTYTVSVAVTDNDGATATDTLQVVVSNAPPAVTGVTATAAVEGSLVTINPVATFTDAGVLDTHTAFINWRDGSPVGGVPLVEADGVGTCGPVTHTYVDNGAYSVFVAVMDNYGDSRLGSAPVIVSNAAPVVTPHADVSGVEGSVVTINPMATFTDAGVDDTHSAIIYWGDGTSEEGAVTEAAGAGTVGSATHTYDDDTTYTVDVVVTDKDGGVGTGTLLAVISNAAPVATPHADVAGVEGLPVTIDPVATFTDAGVSDSHTAIIYWGDGANEAGTVSESSGAGTVDSASHTYTDEGTYSIDVVVTDDDGAVATGTLSAVISNAAPVVTPHADVADVEGTQIKFDSADPIATFTDTGVSDTHEALVYWDDGTEQAGTVSEAGGAGKVTASHTYLDNGTYDVMVVVTDNNGGVATGTLTATVANVAAVVTAAADKSVNENSLLTINPIATFLDAGIVDTHLAYVDWGDGTPAATANVSEIGGSGSVGPVSHNYPDDGVFTVLVVVVDNDGGVGTDSLQVTVSNVAPVVSQRTATISEGPVTFDPLATFTDAPSDTHSVVVIWDNEAPARGTFTFDDGVGTVTATRIYTDDGFATATIVVTDDDGGVGTGTMVVTILNAAPVVTADGDQSVVEGDSVLIDPIATYTDAGSADTHAAQVYWGDGTLDDGVATAGIVTAPSHVYTDDGVCSVDVVVTDDDGGVGTGTLQVTVANADPVVTMLVTTTQTLEEGQSLNLGDVATFTDTGIIDTHTAQIDWGDGGAVDAGVVAEADGAGTVTAAARLFADDGAFLVRVTVTDDDGGSDFGTFPVVVTNVAPITTAVAPLLIIPEGPHAFDPIATYFDPGALDTHSADVDWGDGDITAAVASGGQVTATHAYDGGATYPVTITVSDDDGGVGFATMDIAVFNTPPVTTDTAIEVFEGTSTFDLITFTDGPSDTQEALVIWNDGTTQTGTILFEDGYGAVSATRTYPDDTYDTATVVLSSEDGMATATASIAVKNADPVVTVGADATVEEGSPVTIDPMATFTDAGTSDTHVAAIDWGDGSSEAGNVDEVVGTGSGIVTSATHIYVDDGIYTVSVTVTDDDDGVGIGALTVTVTNAPPVVTAVGDQASSEGEPLTLDPIATFTDAGSSDTHTAQIDWGDGIVGSGGVTETNGSGSVSGTHTYADNGLYTVTITVFDNGGASGSDNLQVTVSNLPPVTAAAADQSADEGLVTIDPLAVFVDPGYLDTHVATVDWGDGSSVQPGIVLEALGAGTVSGSHVYRDEGVFTVTITVTDNDGAFSTDSLVLTVQNVAPAVPNGTVSTQEGTVTISPLATFTDPGLDDTHAAIVSWNDGLTTPGIVTFVNGSGTVSTLRTFADDGVATATVVVTDDDGGVGTGTITVLVANEPPVVAAVPSQMTFEGQPLTLDPIASFTDAGTADTHTAAIDWGDGRSDTGIVTEFAGVGVVTSPAHAYRKYGTYQVDVVVTDDDGGVGTDSLLVTVINVAPTVTGISTNSPVYTSETLQLEATFFDPGADDVFTALVDWGDLTTSNGIVEQADGFGTVTASHVYQRRGLFDVSVVVTDSDGAFGTGLTQIEVFNTTPSVVIPPITRRLGLNAPIDFVLTDFENDLTTLTAFYSITSPAVFLPATLSAGVPETYIGSPGGTTYTLRWDTFADLGLIDTLTQFAIVVTDGMTESTTATSNFFTVDTIPPSTPTLAAEPEWTAGTENTVFLTAPISDAIEYLYEASETSDFSTVFADSGWVSTTSFTFTGLTDGQTYYYHVKARDEALNESGFSTEEISSTQDATTPQAIVTDPSFDQAGYTTQKIAIRVTVIDGGGALKSPLTSLLVYTTNTKTFGFTGTNLSDYVQIVNEPAAAGNRIIEIDSADFGGDGAYYVIALVGDVAGNEDPLAIDRSEILIDLRAPVTQVNFGVAATSSPILAVTYDEDDPLKDDFASGIKDVEVVASVDFGPQTPTGQKAPGGVGEIGFDAPTDGLWEINTQATDRAGNVETGKLPFSGWFVKIDRRAPISNIQATLADFYKTSAFTVNFFYSDPSNSFFGSSGVKDVALQYRLNGGAVVQGPSLGLGFSALVDTALLAGDGFYELWSVATDNVDNVEAAPAVADEATTVDTVRPQSSVDQATLGTEIVGNTVEIPYTTDDVAAANGFKSGVASIRLFVSKTSDTGPFREYTQGGPFKPGDTIEFFSDSTGLPFGGPGTYYFYTLATDFAGNVELAPATADATIHIIGGTPGSSVDAWTLYDCEK